VEFFANRELINADFAMKLLGWKHSGFSIESGTRIYDERARDALSQYIVRAPVSLEKLYRNGETDTVLWHAPRKGPFKGEDRYFSGLDLIAHSLLCTYHPRASIWCYDVRKREKMWKNAVEQLFLCAGFDFCQFRALRSLRLATTGAITIHII